MTDTIFLCYGDPRECQLCGGWVHAGNPPEVPVGEQPIAGRYCSTDCHDEAVRARLGEAMSRAAHSDVPTWLCDYRHDGPQPLAEWLLVGEAGDYAVCDEHFAMRAEEGKRGWTRIERSAPDEADEPRSVTTIAAHIPMSQQFLDALRAETSAPDEGDEHEHHEFEHDCPICVSQADPEFIAATDPSSAPDEVNETEKS